MRTMTEEIGFLQRIELIRKDDPSHGQNGAWAVDSEGVLEAARAAFPEGSVRDSCVSALILSMNVDSEDEKKKWMAIAGVRDALFECGARKNKGMFEVVQFLNEMLPLEQRASYYKIL